MLNLSSYISSNTFSNLSNLKLSISQKVGINTQISSTTTQSTNSNSNEVLGYKVDKDGYFTEEFNKVAGIPSDYKIHSSTMESLVKSQTTTQNFFYFANFQSVDIAKTIGNAYKIVSQLLEKSPELAGKESFSQEDLATYFPRNYVTDKAGSVLRTYTSEEAKDIVDLGGFKLGANEKLNLSFTTMRYKNGVVSDRDAFSFDADILHSGVFGGKEGVYHFDTTSDKYTNEDGSITKGGLLIGFLSHNTFAYNSPSPLIAGETSIQGKINGMDANTNQSQINSLLSFMQSNILILDDENYGEFNDLMSSNLSIDEFQKEYLKLKQRTEDRRKNTQSSTEVADLKTQTMKFLLNELQKANERLSKRNLREIEAQNFDEILSHLNLFEKIDMKA